MGCTEAPFGRLAAMLALLSLLSATVEGSLLGKSLYKRTKEAIDSQDYSAFGKTLHSSRRVPIATYKYEDDTISTARDASSAPVTSLLDRLLKGVSGRSSVKAEESARSAETSPFLSWLSGNGLGSLTGNVATYPVQESAQTIDNVSSTGSLLSLIRKVLDVMRKPETTTSASGSGDVYSVSIGDTTESRIGEIIKQLLGRQSSEAEIVVATTGGTQSGSSSDRTVSELISAIRRLLRDPQSSETDEDGTAADDDSRRPLDIAALIRALARSGERPLAPLQSSDSTVTTVSDIPAPMSTRAALRALIRWISKLNRSQTSKHSPGRFSSIIMNLLSRMASRSSSRSSSPSSDVINTLLSSLNRPGVSVSTSSSLPTSLASLLADLYTPRSSSTASYSSPSPLSTWLKDFENSRSSTKSLSSDSLSDLLDALDVSGGSQQSAPVTSSSSPVIEWLETISTSTGGGSPRETTVSGSVSLDELLSELQDSLGFD